MQKKTKMWIAGGAAILAVGAVAGLANAGMKGGHGMGHGGMGHGGQMAGMMERYDANKDGKLTQDEINQNRTQWQAEFDADKNGTLSLDEFRNLWLKARNAEMVREFQFFDRDGNAQVTVDEYLLPLSDMVANRDRNGDGALSKEDRSRRGEGRGHKRGDRMGHGKGMGQGMGQGMMNDDGGASGSDDSAPAAPANP
ncbi:EF-hand domain-containing protein [Aestuariivirga sp.]|uniref:EF-hand domain-containing protein n=1 Tax=Aestuariivirga sp. TaxID=2650926 RepID=UPI0035940BA6